jgi:hypothetical protein
MYVMFDMHLCALCIICAVPTEELDMIFQSLCFWLKYAPGNASVGPSLMQVRVWSSCLIYWLC